MRIGVILPNWVGDLVMATPLLRALRQQHPTAEIVGVCRKFLTPLLAGTPFIDRYHPWEHSGRGWFGRTAQLVRTLRSEQLDATFVLRNSPYAAGVAYFGGARETIGYSRRGSGLFLTKRLQPPRENGKLTPISGVDYYLQLAAAWGCDIESKQLELATLPADEQAADEQWQRLHLPAGRDVILLNTGGAFGSTKHWPQAESVQLSRRIAEELGHTVVVLCGPNERKEATAIATQAAHPLVKSVAAEDVSFGVTKALVRRARMLVTTDSGPRHIAAALGTPTITLFGPIDPRWSRNVQPDSIELQLSLDCAPCGKKVCPLVHHRCMRDLTSSMVLSAVKKMLTTTADRAASPFPLARAS
jgi:heptosyltransferase-2